jgi:hypothetical protein
MSQDTLLTHPTGPNRPCTARASGASYGTHVLNRGKNRTAVFQKDQDYEAFLDVWAGPRLRYPRRGLRVRRVRSVRGPAASGDVMKRPPGPIATGLNEITSKQP